MEVFEEVQFVRLRSVEQRGAYYVHAAEDGRSVRLDRRRASHNAVWAVQRRLSAGVGGAGGAGTLYVLLRGAYGRYLGAPDAIACGCLPLSSCCPPSRAAAQRDFDEPEVHAIMWRAVATGSPGAVLLHDASGRYLRANPRCLPRRAGVSVSTCGCLGTTMQWAVEAVPRVVFGGRPELPIARDLSTSSPSPADSSEWGKLFALVCPPLSRLCARWFTSEREIRWVRAADSGDFSEDDWASFQYTGRHAILLRTKLVHLLGPPLLFFRLTLCVRAGRHGHPSPLAINLPRSQEPLDIVVVRAGTAADDQLIFPDVAAETAATADNDDEAVLLGSTAPPFTSSIAS